LSDIFPAGEDAGSGTGGLIEIGDGETVVGDWVELGIELGGVELVARSLEEVQERTNIPPPIKLITPIRIYNALSRFNLFFINFNHMI
jgi:hypothetical protein